VVYDWGGGVKINLEGSTGIYLGCQYSFFFK
jgi:hypothetical protein